jgi:hypothetical protein
LTEAPARGHEPGSLVRVGWRKNENSFTRTCHCCKYYRSELRSLLAQPPH